MTKTSRSSRFCSATSSSAARAGEHGTSKARVSSSTRTSAPSRCDQAAA
jgi:hypothetical protein